MKNQSEEMGALWSAKKQPPKRTEQKRPNKQPEKAALRGERCPWKRTTSTMKKKLVKNLKSHKELRIESNNISEITWPEVATSGIFVKQVCFSYGESPRTPPLEGTSLHRWNNSVERPWGILSLFTTCSQVQSPCHSLWHMWTMPQTAHYEEKSPRKQ